MKLLQQSRSRTGQHSTGQTLKERNMSGTPFIDNGLSPEVYFVHQIPTCPSDDHYDLQSLLLGTLHLALFFPHSSVRDMVAQAA